jgi:uncharacterized lipoprotein YmbA
MKRRSLILGTGAVLAGCAAPAPHYFRLIPLPGATVAGVTGTIAVRSISIPGYLDQQNISLPGGAYEIGQAPNDLWAEDLGQMLQAVMVQSLSMRLPGATVLPSGGAIDATASSILEINVLRFDPNPSGDIVLDAQFAVRAGDDASILRHVSLLRTVRPAGAGAGAIAAAMSTLWAQAADTAANLLG